MQEKPPHHFEGDGHGVDKKPNFCSAGATELTRVDETGCRAENPAAG